MTLIAEKKRILFVDDEPMILKAIARMLRPMRNSWSMAFEADPVRALQRIDTERFDVVVSDMMMPKVDGAALLEHTKEVQPDAVRIILSAEAGRDAILRSVPATHQYLAKPCEPDALRGRVARALELQHLLGSEDLSTLVGRLQKLPSAPSLYFELTQELRGPHANLKKIGSIVARDAAMNARVLQLVNSAFFGVPRKIVNARQAAQLLGVELLQALVLGVQVFSSLDARRKEGIDVERIWQDSLGAGLVAGDVARELGLEGASVQTAVAGALLRDIGRLVLAAVDRAEYETVQRRVAEEGLELLDAERAAFGVSHPEVGAFLLGLWGLPTALVEAVAYHHRAPVGHDMEVGPALCVHVAGVLHDEVAGGNAEAEALSDLIPGGAECVARLREHARKRAAGEH